MDHLALIGLRVRQWVHHEVCEAARRHGRTFQGYLLRQTGAKGSADTIDTIFTHIHWRTQR